MLTVATTVGISLYDNYRKGKGDITEHIEVLREEPASAYEEKAARIERMKKPLRDFIVTRGEDASAEVKSMMKINRKLDGDLSVRLIATDTILSVLAAEILAETKCGIGVETHFNRDLDTIVGLQVKDDKAYRDVGSKNLLGRLYKLLEESGGHMAINMTGGFKATIPLLTIFGQLNNVPLYYIFENTDALIEIPKVPLDINWGVFERHAPLFARLEREGVKEIAKGPGARDIVKKYPELDPLLEIADGMVSISALGMIMWQRYKAKREIFYVSNHMEEEYSRSDEGTRKIISTALSNLKRKLIEGSEDPDLRHPLRDCALPAGFYCYKTRADGMQARILWSSEEWQTNYGSKEIDLYVASFYLGRDVHNADTEYVGNIKSLVKDPAFGIFDKRKYDTITIDKGEL